MIKFSGVVGKSFANQKIQALQGKIKEIERNIEEKSLALVQQWKDKGEFYRDSFGNTKTEGLSDSTLLYYAKLFLFGKDWYRTSELKFYNDTLCVMKINSEAEEYTLTREDAIVLGGV